LQIPEQQQLALLHMFQLLQRFDKQPVLEQRLEPKQRQPLAALLEHKKQVQLQQRPDKQQLPE
jgi:hypothetical protein